MTKQASGAFLSMIALERGTALPLYRQLDRQIRDAAAGWAAMGWATAR